LKESKCIDYYRSLDAGREEDCNKIEELLIDNGAGSFEENWASGIQVRAKKQVRKELERGWGGREAVAKGDANDGGCSVLEYDDC
jgi:hypothetical protein